MNKISFKFNKHKAQQAILWFLDKHGGKLDKLKLVKLIFFADREHLRKYARPIIGGDYVAMPHGPVLSKLLDLVNSSTDSAEEIGFKLEDKKVIAIGQYDEDFLSESDIEALELSNSEWGSKDAWRLRDLTHELEAWKKNYQEQTSSPLPYEDFFLDLEDKEILEIIKDDQEAREILG